MCSHSTRRVLMYWTWWWLSHKKIKNICINKRNNRKFLFERSRNLIVRHNYASCSTQTKSHSYLFWLLFFFMRLRYKSLGCPLRSASLTRLQSKHCVAHRTKENRQGRVVVSSRASAQLNEIVCGMNKRVDWTDNYASVDRDRMPGLWIIPEFVRPQCEIIFTSIARHTKTIFVSLFLA